MSMHPQEISPVPAETARIAQAAFPHPTLAMHLRDTLGLLYKDADFAALFPTRGQPAEAPWCLAVVTVLQFVEGLADRPAADAVRARIDWKYALGLELTDAGLHYSVLSEFRARVVAGGREAHFLDALLRACKARGWLKARGRQRTDSTHVLGVVRALNRLILVGETLRHALAILAEVAPDWLRGQIRPEWGERYGRRYDEMRLPKEPAARQVLAEEIGRDGYVLLAALYAPGAPTWLRAVPAVETLRRVWVQQYYRDAAGTAHWRTEGDGGLPPAALQINSPYDTQTRYSVKRRTSWAGYKVHVTETCDEDTPHLLTDGQTTVATTQDVEVSGPVQEARAAKGVPPREHLLAEGYTEAPLLVTSQAAGIDVIGPVRADTSWQARTPGAFAAAQFAVDWEAERVTCPTGGTSVKWLPTQEQDGTAVIRVEFAAAACRACALRTRCTRSATQPRQLTLHPREEHQALVAARERQRTPAFAAQYAARAGVEGTLSQGIRACGLRRSRYVGLAKTHLQHLLTAVAINLVRLVAWLTDTPRSRTRRSRFAALAAAA
ncbi:MAG TPA: IS1182 family transposase [Chloroflexota bacterium]|nr:IS1182 family transposase [Chloroflexota bacterium]